MARSAGKILVVEDEPVLRSLAVEMLAESGYDLLEAASADEALPILRSHFDEICLLFTDVNMAGSIDGLGLARVVATSWPSISILITSGRGAPSRAELPSGAAFTPKPWRAAALVERVEAVCLPAAQ